MGGRDNELARCRGESDLHSVWVAREDRRPCAPGRAVALVNDDMAEVIGGIVRDQEGRRGRVTSDIKRLIGGDQEARIEFGIPGPHHSGVVAEHALKGGGALQTQLVTVTDKERPAQLASVGDALEEVHRDKRLTGTRGQGEECPGLALRDLLQDGPDGGVLVVPARGFAARVPR